MFPRRCGAIALALGALFCMACAEPPDREMQQAKGAIDAARAAGADRYAHDEFVAAEDALKESEEAVVARDYRLALSHALDARERAQNAAMLAADNKAIARADADRALVAALAALNDAHTKLEKAEGARPVPKSLAEWQKTVADADAAVQEARTRFEAGEYLTVVDAMRPLPERLRAIVDAIDALPPPPPRRRR